MQISLLISAVLSYLLGSINSSIIVSRLLHADDIRTHGSGNAGATNTLRVLGKKAAAAVVIGDALKGIIAVIASVFIEKKLFGIENGYAGYIASVFVIIGHVFPLYFGFRGGKGIMTSIAVVFVLSPKIGFILIAVFIAVVIMSNYISLASCVSAFFYPVLVAWIYNGNKAFTVSAAVVAVIAIVKHRSNIVRIIHGNESKFIKHKKGGNENV